MKHNERKERLEDWLDNYPEISPPIENEIDGALYSFAESDLLIDYIDEISFEQAVQCWQIIEKIRSDGSFPEELTI